MSELEIAKDEYITAIINAKKERLKKEFPFAYNYAKEIGLEEIFVFTDGFMKLPKSFKPYNEILKTKLNNKTNTIHRPQIGRNS